MLKRLLLLAYASITPLTSLASECSALFNKTNTSISKNYVSKAETSLVVSGISQSTLNKIPLPPIARLPEELRPLAQEIILQKMGLQVRENQRVSIETSSYHMVDLLRISGLATENQIREAADQVLEKTLNKDYVPSFYP